MFKNRLLKKDFLLDAYFGQFSSRGIVTKCIMIPLKLIRHSPAKVRCKFEDSLYKKAVKRIESNKKYDFVVGFMEGISTQLASYFNCENKIAWIHCDYDRYLPKEISEEPLYSRFKHIVTVAEYTSEVFRKRYPRLSSRVSTIYNIINYDSIKLKSLETIQDCRYDNGSFTIISVGRIDKVKRFSEIPSIAFMLKEKGTRFKWYILGPIREDEEFDKLITNISSYNVSESVLYLGEKTNPYPFFASADLYVCLSYSEACPMVFNEAKIFNLPIVTTDFPSSFEFVRQDKDGMILPLNNIADGISKMIEDSSYYNKVKSCKSNIEKASAVIFDQLDNLFQV